MNSQVQKERQDVLDRLDDLVRRAHELAERLQAQALELEKKDLRLRIVK